MSSAHHETALSPHMQYPTVWELGASGPQGVKDYLEWTLSDTERARSAAESLRYLKIGMHFLTVAQRTLDDGTVVDKLELNFWDEEYPAQTGAGGHAHARDPELWSFIHPRARQRVTGINLLPPGTRRLPNLPIQERRLAILTKVDTGDGLGTIYCPMGLGERLTIETVTDMPPGTHQRFSSLFIHEVAFEGPGTGVTVQRQGPTEQRGLNIFEGLTTYKGLTPPEAEVVLRHGQGVKNALVGAAGKVVAHTVLVRNLDFTLGQMENRAATVPDDRFPDLAEGAIRSIKSLMRSRAAA